MRDRFRIDFAPSVASTEELASVLADDMMRSVQAFVDRHGLYLYLHYDRTSQQEVASITRNRATTYEELPVDGRTLVQLRSVAMRQGKSMGALLRELADQME